MTKTSHAIPALLAAALIASAPVLAQDEEHDGAFSHVGGWTVVEAFAKTCRLTAPPQDDFIVSIAKGGGEVGYLRLQAIGSDRPQRPGRVTFAFDDTIVPGTLIAGNQYLPTALDEEVIALFRSASQMEVRVDGQLRFTVPLKGSSAAYGELVRCASRWPDSTVPVIPPPAPPISTRPTIPDPDLEGPLPANRIVAPIEASRWIRQGDVPIYADVEGSTKIMVAITVGPDGLPTDCEIRQPSDVAAINERTCSLVLDRGKFEPETDASGTPITAKYFLTFRF